MVTVAVFVVAVQVESFLVGLRPVLLRYEVMCPRIWRASLDRCQYHVCSGYVIVLSCVVGAQPPNSPLIRVEEQLELPKKKSLLYPL